MATVLYRINGGEVLKIAVNNQQWTDRDTNYYEVLIDPPFPDGVQLRDGNGDMRVLGFAKINDSGTVRNATQGEIDNFVVAQADDGKKEDKDRAIDLIDTHPQFRKMMIAYSDIVKDEFNLLRQWIESFKTEVDASSNLTDLKSRIAALPNLPDRTLAQLRNALRNRISEND